MKDDSVFEAYEPSDEEWADIEQQLKAEEEEEIRLGKEEDKTEMVVFKLWLKENGMIWDREDVKSAEKRKK